MVDLSFESWLNRDMANTPNTKGQTMTTTTVTVAKVSPALAKQAGEIVAKAKADGLLSNRANLSRMAGVLAGVLTVTKTGQAVEITDLFPATDPTTGKAQTAPAYHLAHRALSADLVRPNWHKVRIVPMITDTVTIAKTTITGETSTTAKVGRVRLFIAPAE